MTTFKRLFEPFSLKGLQLKNRIVMPPMVTNFASVRGEVTDEMVSYYEARAKGGAGLVIIEVAGVDFPRGNTVLHQVAIHEDYCMEGLSRLVNAVKKWGAKIALQLHHAGRRGSSKYGGMTPVAPSPIACYGGEMPEVLDREGILSLVKAFAEGARRAKAVGFDAVELHCAHGYLMSQFLSPLTNTRSDEYGGTLSNRVRFVTEIVEAIREKAGDDYPILARISADEFIPGGIRISDSIEISRLLERAGVDCFHVTGGATPSNLEEYRSQEMPTIPSLYFKGPSFAHLAREIRRSVGVPVIAVGRINDPLMAEQVLEQKQADLVTMGRAFIADPEFPNKAFEGRADEIRKCIACMHCIDLIMKQSPLRCAINPVVGREAQTMPPSEKSKKVLVVGSGPAGMEAARWASLRGHRVTLWEKDHRLGGQLNLAHIPPHKDELKGLNDFLSKQLERQNVPIQLGKEATVELIRQYNPDVLILAAGPVAHVPEALRSVTRTYMAKEILENHTLAEGKVMIIGGGLVGCEVAHWLSSKDKKVTIVELLPELAADVNLFLKNSLLSALEKAGVVTKCGIETFEIKGNKLVLHYKDKAEEVLGWDTVVVCTGYKPNTTLKDSFKDEAFDVIVIGDCSQPRGIDDAISEGFEAGIKI